VLDILESKKGMVMTQDSHDEKRRKHMAMMGAVKPLEWVKHPNAYMWRCDTVVGLYQVAAIAQPATWTFDGLPGQTASGEADDEHEAKAAAQADYSARILSALSIPTDAAAALEAALMGAYKEGWSDGAANYHHDRNETSHEGWLISDTYLDTAAMSQEK
jgi:hypothetical protein